MPLEDLWSRWAHELQRRLDDAKSIQHAIAILLDNLPVDGAEPNPVQNAIEALAAADGNADLDTMARQARLSPRQFRRRCLEESGITPKRLCRVLRFPARLPHRWCGRVGRPLRWRLGISTRRISSAIFSSLPALRPWPFFPIRERPPSKRLEGYPIAMPERTNFYGMLEIGVHEPSGHTVVLATRIS